MKTADSVDHVLLEEMVTVANMAMLKCGFYAGLEQEVLEKMAKSLVIEPEALLSDTKDSDLLVAIECLSTSGLTNGYQATKDDMRGLLSQSHMLGLIWEDISGENNKKGVLNIFNDLVDMAGYHFSLYEEDALGEGFLEFFNEQKPELFRHQISPAELLLLYYYYNFVSQLVSWLKKHGHENKPRLRIVK